MVFKVVCEAALEASGNCMEGACGGLPAEGILVRKSTESCLPSSFDHVSFVVGNFPDFPHTIVAV